MSIRDLWLILHFLSLALLLGSAISVFLITKANAERSPDEKKILMSSTAQAMKPVPPVGLSVLIASGVLLAWPLWPSLKSNGLFHAKMTLVVILIALIIHARRKARLAAQAGGTQAPTKPPFPFPMIIGITIVILAVLVFH